MSGHISPVIHAPHRSAPLTSYGLFVAVILGSMLMHLGRATLGAPDTFLPLTDAPIHSVYRPPESRSCIDPTPADKPHCDAASRRILASTVRLLFLSSGPVRVGHGTVIDGRYIITHNHYASLQRGESPALARAETHLSVALADGQFILRNAPLSSYTVVASRPGLMLLDFKTIKGIGFFDYHGVPSAPLGVAKLSAIRPGSEIAQVNWDGKTTFVEWARVSSIREDGPVPALEIDNFIELGASGGGVFYEGRHIANNWLQGRALRTDTRAVVRLYSVAASDDAGVLTGK